MPHQGIVFSCPMSSGEDFKQSGWYSWGLESTLIESLGLALPYPYIPALLISSCETQGIDTNGKPLVTLCNPDNPGPSANDWFQDGRSRVIWVNETSKDICQVVN